MKKRGSLLAIAGYDPTSGAGILLDVAVFRRLGYHGLGILTAVTAQNTTGVQDVYCLPARFLRRQYRSLAEDMPIAGVKVGMVGCRDNVPAVARILADLKNVPIVVDPVFRASSGKWLLEREAVPEYVASLKGRVTVLTPNLDEASLLFGHRVDGLETMKRAAARIAGAIGAAVVIKGGDLSGMAANVLTDGSAFHVFEKRKIRKDVHGTGCFFSSSLLCHLADGHPVVEAVRLATEYTYDAIKTAVRLGKGRLIIAGS
jgi:hydroxymethylpyrimidine kinase/phosphomethylpyrimidine kinase